MQNFLESENFVLIKFQILPHSMAESTSLSLKMIVQKVDFVNTKNLPNMGLLAKFFYVLLC